MRLVNHVATTVAALLLAMSPAAAQPTLDSLADDYVVLILQSGDTPYDPAKGPPFPKRIMERLTGARPAKSEIIARFNGIVTAVDALPVPPDPILAMRQRYLRAHAESAALQLDPGALAKLDTAAKVRRLYGFDPVFEPLASFDAAIDRFDKALPGDGTMSERIDAMRKRAQVPPDKIEPLMRAAVAECRRRSAAHLRIPPDSLELHFPDDPLVPAQSQYLGNGKGKISVSTAIPIDVDRLLVSACHETYPGHHLHFLTLDHELAKKRGWTEALGMLEFEPNFAVSDAISEYGTGLAFPLDERMKYQRDVLFPMAGLTMQDEPAWRALLTARSSVLGATSTVIRDYLDKRIDADTAKRLAMRYRLMNPRAAEQLIKMVDAFGVDIIASDQGWLAIDRAFADKPEAERWRLFQRMLEEPMLLGDVRALAKP